MAHLVGRLDLAREPVPCRKVVVDSNLLKRITVKNMVNFWMVLTCFENMGDILDDLDFCF